MLYLKESHYTQQKNLNPITNNANNREGKEYYRNRNIKNKNNLINDNQKKYEKINIKNVNPYDEQFPNNIKQDIGVMPNLNGDNQFKGSLDNNTAGMHIITEEEMAKYILFGDFNYNSNLTDEKHRKAEEALASYFRGGK